MPKYQPVLVELHKLKAELIRRYYGDDPPNVPFIQVDFRLYSSVVIERRHNLTIDDLLRETAEHLLSAVPLKLNYRVGEKVGRFEILAILETSEFFTLVLRSGQRHYLPKRFSAFNPPIFTGNELQISYNPGSKYGESILRKIKDVNDMFVLVYGSGVNEQRFYLPKMKECGQAEFEARPHSLFRKEKKKEKRVYPEWAKQPDHIKNVFRKTRF